MDGRLWVELIRQVNLNGEHQHHYYKNHQHQYSLWRGPTKAETREPQLDSLSGTCHKGIQTLASVTIRIVQLRRLKLALTQPVLAAHYLAVTFYIGIRGRKDIKLAWVCVCGWVGAERGVRQAKKTDRLVNIVFVRRERQREYK